MATPTVFAFGKGLVYLGDGAGSEVFSKLCGFKNISLTVEKDTNDTVIADCDDPDLAVWRDTDVTAMGWNAEFSGEMAKAAEALLWVAVNGNVSRNIRFHIVGGGTGGGTPDLQFSGAAHITYAITGEFGGKLQIAVTATGDGALTRTNVAALA